MASDYTIRNLDDVEDAAAKYGFEHGESRFANDDLETEQTGVSFHRLKPNTRQSFGHHHDDAEEIYVVIGGSGRLKLDDEIVEVGERDAVRVAPSVVRAWEGGPNGLEVIAFGPRRGDDRGEILPGWWSD